MQLGGALQILGERERQQAEERWTDEHDDMHGAGELAQAALCYVREAIADEQGLFRSTVPSDWPWDEVWWKPTDSIGDLVKAGALIAAEIDRLERLMARNSEAATT